MSPIGPWKGGCPQDVIAAARASASPVATLRLARGLSREDLARLAAVSERSVTEAELGLPLLREEIEALADALGVEAALLQRPQTMRGEEPRSRGFGPGFARPSRPPHGVSRPPGDAGT